jgi:adenylate cyclase
MEEDNSKKTGPQSRNIEQIIRERELLDQILEKEFRKKMAILFTDVCGYTQYMDTRGDISGRAWIQKHHNIVLPLIEKHEGSVLSIMGDGVMASFSTTLSAVKASVAIQKGLDKYNSEADPADAIHVRIGINTGMILVDKDHIAGGVVNVASRIETQAGQDQILISKPVYEEKSV